MLLIAKTPPPSTNSLKQTRHVLKGQKPEAQGRRSAALGKRPYKIRPCKGRRNQTSFRKLLPIHHLPQSPTPSTESASHALAQDNVWASKTYKRRPGLPSPKILSAEGARQIYFLLSPFYYLAAAGGAQGADLIISLNNLRNREPLGIMPTGVPRRPRAGGRRPTGIHVNFACKDLENRVRVIGKEAILCAKAVRLR